MKINEILQDFVNKDYNELLSIAKRASADILPYCEKWDKTDEGAFLLLNILIASVNADGKISDLECKFIAELTGSTQETVRAVGVEILPELAENFVDLFVDSLELKEKSIAFTLIAAILACDKRIIVEENRFIRRIVG